MYSQGERGADYPHGECYICVRVLVLVLVFRKYFEVYVTLCCKYFWTGPRSQDCGRLM